MTPFAVYMTGFSVLIAGLALAAYLLGAPTLAILVGGVILLAIGYVVATNQR